MRAARKTAPQSTQRQPLEELILRRRLQLLVHSSIYYEFDQSVVSDEQWKTWALELEALQRENPDIANALPWADAFRGFDHSTGYDLPTRDPWVMGQARWVLSLTEQYR